MKAALSITAGGPETLVIADAALPDAGPGEILVRVKACAVNYPDVLIIEDRYQFKPTRPFSPGCEVAGLVEAVGDGVSAYAPGDRVIGTMISGGFAEYAVVSAQSAYQLPANRSFVEGAALLLTYATTYHALADRARIAANDTLLVPGAAGGVGLAAIQLGKAFGARVVGAVSSEAKVRAVLEAGADDAIVYAAEPSDAPASRALARQFKSVVGDAGAHVIYDAVGGAYTVPALRSIAWGGRYLVVGFPAGVPDLPLNLVLLKGCEVVGVFWGAFADREPAANRANVAKLFALWDAGKIAPCVTATYPLAQAGQAITALAERRTIGKIVVELD